MLEYDVTDKIIHSGMNTILTVNLLAMIWMLIICKRRNFQDKKQETTKTRGGVRYSLKMEGKL